MYFRSAEDRLNPVAPPDADESTLAGYFAIHGRSPGFTGKDEMPYTTAIEAEPSEEDEGIWVAYIVFLRWAADSTAIMGHIDSPDLARGRTEADVRESIGKLPLTDVKRLLDESIDRRTEADGLDRS